MAAVAILAMALVGQDPDVAQALARISDTDAATSFRAISDLLDLPSDRRVKIEEAAAALPAFFREFLRSELEAREALGPAFGRPARVSVEAQARFVDELLLETAGRGGIKVRRPSFPKDQAIPRIDLSLKDVPVLEALDQIGRSVRFVPRTHYGSRDRILFAPEGPRGCPSTYRNFAVFLTYTGFRTTIDLRNVPVRSAELSLDVFCDSGVNVVRWEPRVRILEAVTPDGSRLEEAPEEPGRVVVRSEDEPLTGRSGTLPLARLRLPDRKATTLTRLRVAVTARIPRSVRRFDLDPKIGAAEDAEFGLEVRPDEDSGPTLQIVTIRPKRIRPGELAQLPVRFNSRFEGAEVGTTWARGEPGKDAVVYRVGFTPGGVRPGRLERIIVEIPLDLVDRHIFAELRNVKLE